MKKYLSLLFIVVMLLLAACGGSDDGGNTTEGSTDDNNKDSNTTEEEVTINIGQVASEQSTWQDAVVHFAEKSEEYTNGSVKFEIFPGGQLGGDREMLESVQNGSLDAGFISLALFESITPVFTGFQLPFVIDSYETSNKANNSETAQKALDTLDEFDMKGLSIVDTGSRMLGNNIHPIEKPEDFKGLKLRSSESALLLEMFEALGASPTPMPFPEIYTALQTGVIDGQDQITPTWTSDKHGEVIDHLSQLNMYNWQAIFVLNKNLFDSLSDSQQEALEKAAKETTDFMFERLAADDEEAFDELEEMGVEIIREVDTDPFYNAVEHIIDEYAQKDPLVQEMLDTINDIKDAN